MPQTGKKAGNLSEEYVRMYFEHQYDRMGALEDQSFRLSSLVVALAAAVFAFGSTQRADLTLLPWHLLISLLLATNVIAILYILRVSHSAWTHQRRAKHVLELFASQLFTIDKEHPQRFTGSIQGRPLLQIILHVFLLVGGIIALLFGA